MGFVFKYDFKRIISISGISSLVIVGLDNWYSIHMEYSTYKKIPNSLRKYRKEKGLSQKDVAGFLRIKDNTLISRWESGESIPNFVNIT